MIVLVTGSAGHLGEALMRRLPDAGISVRGLDVVASRWTDVVGSITDRGVVGEAMDGVTAVIHTATLHKPHVTSHSRSEFVDVNVCGTTTLLETAVAAGVESLVFTSTTSAFGAALSPPPGQPAAWIDEDVVPVPKNIYGVTKVAAEDLCAEVARNEGLPVVVLRTSRFFPEADDDPTAQGDMTDDNHKLVEYLHRRVSLEDVVSAHACALQRAPQVGFGRFVISATSPFRREDRDELRRDAAAVVRRRVPDVAPRLARLGWRLPPTLDRVYDNRRARDTLGWRPQHDFSTILQAACSGDGVQTPLAQLVGAKGYHDRPHGVYTPPGARRVGGEGPG